MNADLLPIIRALAHLSRSILDNHEDTERQQDQLLQDVLALPPSVLEPLAAASIRRAVLSRVPQRLLTEVMNLLFVPIAVAEPEVVPTDDTLLVPAPEVAP